MEVLELLTNHTAKRAACLLVAMTVWAGCKDGPPAVPPQAAQTTSADSALPRAFTVGPFTRPLREAGDDDWLAQHAEKGQTFEQWEKAEKQIPSAERRVIYLQPIGDFDGPRSVDLERLRTFTQAFFQLPVVVTEPMSVEHFTTREHSDFGRQVKSGDVLAALRERLPDDAYCMLGVTMEDLYPRESWNFVFGMASLVHRTGVFSLARYSPQGEGELSESKRLILTERAFKVLSHEIGHMFGIKHCTAWHCGMNGSNHLRETDGAPISYCPVCLRKLQTSVGFNVAERDQKLVEVMSSVGLDRHAIWYHDRREWLLGE